MRPATAWLAPLSGITDVAFRRIAARFGAGRVVTEMVAADAYVRGAEEARLRSAGEGISPHVVQLVGRDPARMADAARLAEASGADIVDINMGCPAKHVLGGLAGSGLMREPSLALSLIEAVVGAVRVPVTVKMRLGWDRTQINAPDIAVSAQSAGAAGLVVHGRTRADFYKNRADWRAIRDVVEAVHIPVVANGDIDSLEAAQGCLSASRAADVMIGRAALGQPWIVGEIAAGLRGARGSAPSWALRTDIACEHYEALLGLYGVRLGVRHARKHLAAYAERAAEAGFGLPVRDRRDLVTSEDPTRVLALLRRIYDQPMQVAA